MNKTPILANFDLSSNYVFGLGWIVLFIAVVGAYWPGLGGPFVLDDFGSVRALGNRGGVVDWETFKAYVFGGSSGPTGRPLAMATFLIDANNWPAEPWPFKRTNLVIHCLCGIFLGVLVHRVLAILRYDIATIRCLTIAAAGIWLLHPFLVSTTLYVVQRMAQLSTLFSLAGLAMYLRGRVLLPRQAKRGYLLMTSSLALFGALAILSKENGMLLPLFAAVIECTVVASQRETLGHLNRYWLAVFLLAPTLLVFGYLGTRVFSDGFFEVVPPRDFSLYERALTEARILFDYVQHWFIPKLYTTGVFQDHFSKSTSFLMPLTTLLSWLGHIFVVAVALIKRRHWPLFAFAALFFYTSHLLESTVVNLELYFEHRNYMASGFLFLPLLVAIHGKMRRAYFALICLSAFLLLGSFTRYSASVWASWPAMIEASAHKAPSSARAQAQYSVLLFKAGRHTESLDVLDRAIATVAGPSPLLNVNRLVTLCELGALSAEEFERESGKLDGIPYDARMIIVYSKLSNAVVAGKCPDITPLRLSQFFSQMLKVLHNANRESLEYSQVQYLTGLSHAYAGDRQSAVAAFHESVRARPGASHAMQMAAVLASNDFGPAALEFSDLALQELAEHAPGLLRASEVSESDIHIFQAIVRADIKALQDVDTSGAEQ